ncbi:unnamed protein product, partial [Onchocerca flexuosa]|uniref:Pecanex-like protein n=1 Tax=Onchocerca flexuosa TaxID=387005 RepID=A0A183H5Y9_9BILA
TNYPAERAEGPTDRPEVSSVHRSICPRRFPLPSFLSGGAAVCYLQQQINQSTVLAFSFLHAVIVAG